MKGLKVSGQSVVYGQVRGNDTSKEFMDRVFAIYASAWEYEASEQNFAFRQKMYSSNFKPLGKETNVNENLQRGPTGNTNYPGSWSIRAV